MPTTRWSSAIPFAAIIMLPLLAGLGGCVALPLLELAAMPAAQSTGCAAGNSATVTPGCNSGATGSMIPGMATVMQVLSAPLQTSH